MVSKVTLIEVPVIHPVREELVGFPLGLISLASYVKKYKEDIDFKIEPLQLEFYKKNEVFRIFNLSIWIQFT